MTARALRVACPFATCRAMPLFPCRNRDGEAMARPHSARVLAGDRAVLDRRLAARASISLSAAGYQAIRAVAKARGVPMRAEVDAIITAGLDAVGAP